MEEIANTVRYLALIALIINWIHKKRSKYIGMYLLPNIGCILRIKIMCVQESKCNYSAYQKSGKKEGFGMEPKNHDMVVLPYLLHHYSVYLFCQGT